MANSSFFNTQWQNGDVAEDGQPGNHPWERWRLADEFRAWGSSFSLLRNPKQLAS
jgi:hypothetical protein